MLCACVCAAATVLGSENAPRSRPATKEGHSEQAHTRQRGVDHASSRAAVRSVLCAKPSEAFRLDNAGIENKETLR